MLTGTDDGNVRIWKARAADRLGPSNGRELAARQYRDKLRERWKNDAEVGRIDRYVLDAIPTSFLLTLLFSSRHRHLPKAVYAAVKLKKTMIDAHRDREDRARSFGRDKDVPVKTEISKVVITQQE